MIIPCFNEERRLPKCLESIRRQEQSDYNISVIVVDDISTDETVAVAREFGATILTSGRHDIEVSKKIGLDAVTTPLVFFLDADNWLPSDDWLSVARQALLEHPGATGVQAAWFEYVPSDPVANRYCSLYGAADPIAYYLRVRDRLMANETVWSLGGRVVADADKYWLLEADGSRLLTFGSQGFLTRTEDAQGYAKGKTFYHIDFVYQRVLLGHPYILLLKRSVGHDNCEDVRSLIRKLKRNIVLFHGVNERSYRYDLSLVDKAIVSIVALSCFIPLVDAWRGFLRGPRDYAWFLHPVLCLIIGVMYLIIHIAYTVKKYLFR